MCFKVIEDCKIREIVNRTATQYLEWLEARAINNGTKHLTLNTVITLSTQVKKTTLEHLWEINTLPVTKRESPVSFHVILFPVTYVRDSAGSITDSKLHYKTCG